MQPQMQLHTHTNTHTNTHAHARARAFTHMCVHTYANKHDHPSSPACGHARPSSCHTQRSLLRAHAQSFKAESGRFMRGEVTAEAYHRTMVSLNLIKVTPELAALCPDPKKREELMAAHRCGGVYRYITSVCTSSTGITVSVVEHGVCGSLHSNAHARTHARTHLLTSLATGHI